jgi:hypothetical protein
MGVREFVRVRNVLLVLGCTFVSFGVRIRRNNVKVLDMYDLAVFIVCKMEIPTVYCSFAS